jgi:drug/metabolite transporter (DMT)-like permease
VIAVALAGLLLGEAVGRRRLLGGALVVAGVFLLTV